MNNKLVKYSLQKLYKSCYMFILFFFFLINGTAIYTYIQVVQFCALIKILAAKINCLQHCSALFLDGCRQFISKSDTRRDDKHEKCS